MITGTYNLLADPSWSLLQLNEVRLECDTTTGPVTINLPAISTLAQSTNLKLVIVDATANASSNNITINAGVSGTPPISDTFDDSSNNQIVLNTDGSSVVFQNLTSTQWLAVESVAAGGGGALPATTGSLQNIAPSTTISSPLPRVFALGQTLQSLVPFTGTTSETIIGSILIPKNTFIIGDYLNGPILFCEGTVSQLSGGLVLKAYYNTTNSLVGATTTNNSTFSGLGFTGFNFDFQIANGIKGGKFIANSIFRDINIPNTLPFAYNDIACFDITQDIYLIVTATLNNPADILVLKTIISTRVNILQTV